MWTASKNTCQPSSYPPDGPIAATITQFHTSGSATCQPLLIRLRNNSRLTKAFSAQKFPAQEHQPVMSAKMCNVSPAALQAKFVKFFTISIPLIIQIRRGDFHRCNRNSIRTINSIISNRDPEKAGKYPLPFWERDGDSPLMRTKSGNGDHVDLEQFVKDIKTVVQDGEVLLKAGITQVKRRAIAGAKSTEFPG